MPTTKTYCSQMNFLKWAKDITKEDNIKWLVSTWKNVQDAMQVKETVFKIKSVL